jgi:uncharacterized protein
MNGVLYLAQGKGPHVTVVFLHGFPGDEKNADLAHAVRRAGFNALVFHYRGAWGSEGQYSRSHVLEDVAAALQWLRTPAVADSYSVNRWQLVLVGHSMGGFAALYGAAADSEVRAVAALAPVDLGRRGERLKDPETFAAYQRWADPQLGALRGTSGKALAGAARPCDGVAVAALRAHPGWEASPAHRSDTGCPRAFGRSVRTAGSGPEARGGATPDGRDTRR